MKVIAKVLNINFDAICSYIKTTPWKQINSNFKTNSSKWDGTDLWTYFRDSKLFTNSFYYSSDKEEYKFAKAENIEEFENLYNGIKENKKSINVFYRDEYVTFVQCGVRVELFPSQFVEVEDVIDFDKVTLAEAPKLLGTTIDDFSLANLNDSISIESLKKDLNKAQLDLKTQEEEMKNEVAKIEEEARKQIAILKENMQLKMQELELKKKEMEKNIFDLDFQLYSLRCLLGDSVDVIQLRSGKTAPLEQPVVIFQKLRYLDEDLAKLKTIYQYAYESNKRIEKILANDDYVFNLFCPNDKCIILLKTTKSPVGYISTVENTLTLSEKENGNKIAILLRNGENLYIIWTEEERINIKENFIVARNNQVTQLSDENNDNFDPDIIRNDDYTNDKDIAWKQYFSRRFLIAILQGLSTYKKIIEFPEEVNFSKPSSYILFSMADNQLTDNSYGSLSDYMKYTSNLTKKGDYILPIQSISGSYTEHDCWGNGYHQNHERGRGEKNRVDGLSIPDNVQIINLVDDIIRTICIGPTQKWEIERANELKTPEEREKRLKELKEEEEEYTSIIKLMRERNQDTYTTNNITYRRQYRDAGKGMVWKASNKRIEEIDQLEKAVHTTDPNNFKYYVSIEKGENWNSKRTTNRRVASNIQIYEDEFINLTWLSSEILKYYLNTKQIGKYFGADYAYAINYLHKAIDFIQKREQEEKEYFKTIVNYNFEDIPHFESLVISYKITNNIHNWNNRTVKGLMTWLFSLKGDYEEAYKNILCNLPWVKKEN